MSHPNQVSLNKSAHVCNIKIHLISGNPLICNCKSSRFWQSVESHKRLFQTEEYRKWFGCLAGLLNSTCPQALFSYFSVTKHSATEVKVSWSHYIYPVTNAKLILATSDKNYLYGTENVSTSLNEQIVGNLMPGTLYKVCVVIMTSNTRSTRLETVAEDGHREHIICENIRTEGNVLVFEATAVTVIITVLSTVVVVVFMAVAAWFMIFRSRKN
ncbi:hypothetical protein GQR58_021036 [Nymphon striatum]|nr:hypothetical protein GQR58_021036 [Nymphon striatum]